MGHWGGPAELKEQTPKKPEYPIATYAPSLGGLLGRSLPQFLMDFSIFFRMLDCNFT